MMENDLQIAEIGWKAKTKFDKSLIYPRLVFHSGFCSLAYAAGSVNVNLVNFAIYATMIL